MCADQLSPTFYKKFGMSTEQWNAIGEKAQDICKANPKAIYSIMGLIENGMKPEELGMQLAKKNAEKLSGVGTTVEKQNVSKLDAMKPKVVLEDMENKDIRDASEAQWKDYFEARYKANSSEAKYDIARVIYRKQVAQVQAGLNNMLHDKKQSYVVKAKYLAEGFATNKEQDAYAKEMDRLKARYKENPDEAIRDYNGLFRVDGYNDPVDEGGHLTGEQYDALIKMKALDNFEIDSDRLENMAVTAVANNAYSKGVKKANEYYAKAEKLKTEAAQTPEGRKLQQEVIEQDVKYDREAAKLLQEAQTEESVKLYNENIKRNKEAEAEIAKQKRLGNDAKATELEKKRLEDNAEAEKAIRAAMDQDKLKQSEEIAKKRYEARLAGEKELYNLIDPKTRAKIEELEAKAAEELKKAKTQTDENLAEQIPDIAAIMAEAQVDKQRAEARFNRTTVHWGDGKTKDDGKTRNTYLDDEMRQFVQDNPELFCDEVEEGSDFTGTKRNPETGEKVQVGYKFNEQKFQDYMLRLSNSNQLDNADADDPANKADYYATIKERKELNDAKNHGYALPAKLKDRRFAKKCYDAAGLDLEKDKTIGKRWANLAKKTIVGAGVGGGVALLSEYISTTKIVESKFFKIVEYAGSVPYMQMVHVKGQTDAELTGRYQTTKHIEGTQGYSQDIEVSGIAEGDVTLPYSGTQHYTQDYSQYYSGSKDYTYSGSGTVTGTVSGTVTGDYSGVASDVIGVEHTHSDYQNGYLVGSKTWTEDVNVDIPYQGQVSIPYEQGYSQDYTYSGSGTVNYDGYVNGTVEGDVAYSGTTTGKGKIPYKQTVTATGEVKWEADVEIDDEVTLKGKADYETDVKVEGEAEYKGQEEVSGTTTGRPKVDWGNIGKATIIGVIGGAAKGLMDWNKIYDEGGRKYGIARQVLSEKGVDAKPQAQPTPQPSGQEDTPAPLPATPPGLVVPQAEMPDQISPVGPVSPAADAKKDEFESCINPQEGDKFEPVKFNIGAQKTGKTKTVDGKQYAEYEAHLWQSLYNAYGIKTSEQKAFRAAYRKEVLGGKAFFTGKEQSVNPTFTFKGQELPFDLKAFNDTPKEKYYQRTGVTSATVSEKGGQGPTTWSGTATATLADGTVVEFATTKNHASKEEAEADLKAQIDADKTLTPAQKEEARKSVDAGCKQNA